MKNAKMKNAKMKKLLDRNEEGMRVCLPGPDDEEF
jgi:hypothetical protein